MPDSDETVPNDHEVMHTVGPSSGPGSPATSVKGSTLSNVPWEVVKSLPVFAREGMAFFKTVGAGSRIWNDIIINWIQFEKSCQTKGVGPFNLFVLVNFT